MQSGMPTAFDSNWQENGRGGLENSEYKFTDMAHWKSMQSGIESLTKATGSSVDVYRFLCLIEEIVRAGPTLQKLTDSISQKSTVDKKEDIVYIVALLNMLYGTVLTLDEYTAQCVRIVEAVREQVILHGESFGCDRDEVLSSADEMRRMRKDFP